MLNEARIEEKMSHDAPVVAWPERRLEADAAYQPVVVLPGHGVGPEIMEACLGVLQKAAPGLDWIHADIGSEARPATPFSLPNATLDAISDAGVVLKGPLAGPRDGEPKPDAVLRKALELYGHIRPVKQLPYPGLPYAFSDIDVIFVRENADDAQTRLEYMQTPNVAQSLRLVTRPDADRIARLAFALAEAEGRQVVHYAGRADAAELTRDLARSVFETVAGDHPDIDARHLRLEDCAQELLAAPQQFQVILADRMNGDFAADLATSLVGGFGRCAAADIGHEAAVFHPLHGTLADSAGQNAANPTAMIMAGVMMLRHLGLAHEAHRVEQAVRRVYQEGIALTTDVALPGRAVGTNAFAEAVIEQIDMAPPAAPQAASRLFVPPPPRPAPRRKTKRRVDGLDVFVEWRGPAEELIARLEPHSDRNGFQLYLVTDTGAERGAGEATSDQFLCRFRYNRKHGNPERDAAELLERLSRAVCWMHVEKLTTFDGTPGYHALRGAW